MQVLPNARIRLDRQRSRHADYGIIPVSGWQSQNQSTSRRVLVRLNQGDLIVSGQLTPRVVVKSLLTPLILFCDPLLGAVLNSYTAV